MHTNWCGSIRNLYLKLGRWLSGQNHLLCKHKDLSSNPQHPCKTQGMATHMPVTLVQLGRGAGGLLAAGLAPGSVKDFVSSQGTKAESDRVRHLMSSPGFCIHAHTYLHARLIIHLCVYCVGSWPTNRLTRGIFTCSALCWNKCALANLQSEGTTLFFSLFII